MSHVLRRECFLLKRHLPAGGSRHRGHRKCRHRAAGPKSEGIVGAGLDVFASEPDLKPRFLALRNVVLAPHYASLTIIASAPDVTVQCRWHRYHCLDYFVELFDQKSREIDDATARSTSGLSL
jgi:hypothetical protein